MRNQSRRRDQFKSRVKNPAFSFKQKRSAEPEGPSPCPYPIKKTTLHYQDGRRDLLAALALKGRLLFVPALPALRSGRTRGFKPLPISNKKDHFYKWSFLLERAKGFEPSTSTLARLRSTPELHPRFVFTLPDYNGCFCFCNKNFYFMQLFFKPAVSNGYIRRICLFPVLIGSLFIYDNDR